MQSPVIYIISTSYNMQTKCRDKQFAKTCHNKQRISALANIKAFTHNQFFNVFSLKLFKIVQFMNFKDLAILIVQDVGKDPVKEMEQKSNIS